MRVVTPLAITAGGTLTSTNVDTSADPAAYNAVTVYTLGQRSLGSDGMVYESIFATGHSGNDPTLAASSTYWGLRGVINKLAMFDARVGTQTTFANYIEVEVTLGDIADLLSLRNMDAFQVTVTGTDPVEGIVFGPETYLLQEDVGDWWEYLYSPIVQSPELLVLDLPPYASAVWKVKIDNTGGTAKCGLFVMGPALEAGDAEVGASDELDDFSSADPDQFGVRDIVERDYADDASFTVYVDADIAPLFRRTLAARRAQPTLFVLDDTRPDAQYYGLPSFEHVFLLGENDETDEPGLDVFTVKVKGVT
jgi:hypothetical protein